jgi:hypothetical protein
MLTGLFELTYTPKLKEKTVGQNVTEVMQIMKEGINTYLQVNEKGGGIFY